MRDLRYQARGPRRGTEPAPHFVKNSMRATIAHIPLQPEPLPCREAFIVAGLTSPADIGSHGVDCTSRRNANVADQRRTTIANTAHAAKTVIDILVRNERKRAFFFQRKSR